MDKLYLAFWYDITDQSGIFFFQRTVNTIKAHWNGIINHIKSRINNGILESLNVKIQLAKKKSEGVKTFQTISI